MKVLEHDPDLAARYKLKEIFCWAWLSHAISGIAHHRVPEFIGDEQATSVDEVAKETNLHAPSLYRALRALAANGIFEETIPKHFKHNAVSRLLRADYPQSWRAMARMWNHPSCLSAWQHFPEVLTDGHSGIEHAFGKPLYGHLHDNPAAGQAFAEAMISNSAQPSAEIARSYPFDKYSTVVDLGGGVGTLLAAILEEHPHLTGVLFEIDDLKIPAMSYLSAKGLQDRAQVSIGSFFDSVPPDLDLYLVKNSLWNWSDERCLEIMRNVRRAIGAGSDRRFVIIEYVINDANAAWTTVYDLQILNMPGGRARSETEYRELLRQCQFDVEEVRYVQDQTLLIANPV
jgi:hypothetical protein